MLAGSVNQANFKANLVNLLTEFLSEISECFYAAFHTRETFYYAEGMWTKKAAFHAFPLSSHCPLGLQSSAEAGLLCGTSQQRG